MDHVGNNPKGKHGYREDRGVGSRVEGGGGKTVVQFHDVLHGFHAGWGTETAMMEIQLTHELANVDQDPLLLELLDIRKAYDNLDRTCSTKVCDNLLVELDTFYHFRDIILCNAKHLQFNRGGNKNLRAQVRKFSMPLRCTFTKLMGLLVTFMSHKHFLIVAAPL